MNRYKAVKRSVRRLLRAWHRAGFDGIDHVPQPREAWEAWQDARQEYGDASEQARAAERLAWEESRAYTAKCRQFRELRDAIEHASQLRVYLRCDDQERWEIRHDC